MNDKDSYNFVKQAIRSYNMVDNGCKKQCTDKEWMTCREEKMGCKGCYYKDYMRVDEKEEQKDDSLESDNG